MRFLKKLKIELPYDSAIPLLSIIGKDTCTSMFIEALLTMDKIWKQPKYPSTDDWINKMWCVYIHGLPWWLGVNNPPTRVVDADSIPGSRKSPGEGWQFTPVFLPEKSHGQRSLVGYSPWGWQRVRHDLATKKQQ